MPRLADGVWVAEGAVIVGDVEIGPGSSVWFGAVVRGDVNQVRIGARTNLQDHSILHVTSGTHPTSVGDDVTLGHRVTLHGCTVKDRCLDRHRRDGPGRRGGRRGVHGRRPARSCRPGWSCRRERSPSGPRPA